MLHPLRRSVNGAHHKLRKLFYVKDFVTLIRPYVFLMSVLGYFPYSVSLSTYKSVKKNLAWSLIILIKLTLLYPILLYKILSMDVMKDFSVRLHYSSIYIFGLVCLWTSYLSSRSKLHLLRMISTASRLLSPKTFHRTAKWMFAIDFLKIAVFLSYLFSISRDPWTALFYLMSYFVFLVALVMIMLFVNCLYVLNLCFCKINTSLEKLRTSLVTDEPHLLRRVYHSQKNPTLLSELKTLRRQYLELAKIVDASNDTFGLEMIVLIALTMMDITFNLYTYLVLNTDDGKIVNLWSINIKYLANNCQGLIFMAIVCEMVKDQAKNIAYNIHRILVITFDEQISTELALFSMQVLQQNHTIVARGLVIDVTLLTKIVGIITTYLLILIQFLLMTPC
ncbi:uncharacterized protein LOC117222553 [Megalopta genalis]|uniref:uncharacterized protein LOC117222553 n=1 Tax=Megalopta genalis TaxID=115081 RepID=UPI003FD38BAF